MAPRRVWRAHRTRLALSACVLAACAALLPREREPFQAALAALANLFACHQFGSTLLPGREPLVSRYARFDFGHLPPDYAGYTRLLTALWAALLAGFAAAQTLAAARHLSVSCTMAVELAACAVLFFGEHAVRGLLFPRLPPASLRRTFRAVRLAHAAPRDAAA